MGKETRAAVQALPESASVLLDVVRFSAAILVVIGHMTHPEFQMGYADHQILGDYAVPVFFVLSGFVIRFVTRTRESTAREYWIDRASRIYSVVLPAMLFTLLVSGACFLMDRERFLRDWAGPFNHPGLRLLFNLTFVSQAWGRNTIPFLNPPFWSMGYECIYYLFYGFLFFFRGWKRVLLCAAGAAIIGPQVLFLFPIWWLGCWMYDLYTWCRGARPMQVALMVVAGGLTTGAILFVTGFRGVLLGPARLFHWIEHLRNPIEAAGMSPMRATMFAVGTGLFCAVLLFPLLLAMDHVAISRSNRWARGFRRIADGTFTIYLMHYPFLVLLFFAGLLLPGHRLSNLVVATLMCALLIALAVPVDWLKLWMRRWLRSIFPPKASA